MNQDQIEQRVEGLLTSPLGCLFLLQVDALDITPDVITRPDICFREAAADVHIIDRNTGINTEVVAEVLGRGADLAPLARSILEHAGSSWWFDSIDLDHQVWVSIGHSPLETAHWTTPQSPAHSWERYAQKPIGNQCTSNMYGDTSSLLISYEERAGDMYAEFPLECWALRVLSEVRVFEIHGPEDWHRLCVTYPAYGRAGDGRDETRLVPDWGAAARDWDCVHLSFGGWLLCEQRRYEQDGQWSQHELWHCESTFWLNAISSQSRRLPDHEHTQGPVWLGRSELRLDSMQP